MRQTATRLAADAVNALGVDLLSVSTRRNANALLSPYSIQIALAMTYAGAEGATRDEMARALHYPPADADLHASFAALRRSLEFGVRESEEAAARDRRSGDPIVFATVSRLFGQQGYAFRKEFLDLLGGTYGAPLQPADFATRCDRERRRINAWVERETRDRIKDLIPLGSLSSDTRLALVNALYLKAPWSSPFDPDATAPLPFQTGSGESVDVPTMRQLAEMGYQRREGHVVVALPYRGEDLQLLILLPDARDGLPALESRLTAALLRETVSMRVVEVLLHLPRFRIESPSLRLRQGLESLGMRTAFDVPAGSANFDRMAPRRPGDWLGIDDVFHKTFLDVDEAGTEAAAATSVVMATRSLADRPIPVNVDHPFLFAIQHRSGACLFLGRVIDPRSSA